MNPARQALNGALRVLLLTLPLSLLSGCGLAPEELRGTAYLAISVEGDQPLTKAILQEKVLQAQAIVAAFRQLHPHVAIETNLFRESDFVEEVHRRRAAGLGPDLMLVAGSTAHALVEADLARSFQLPQATRRQVDPDSLSRLEIPPRGLAGLPILRRPQLACYNRTRLASSPANTDDLLTQARGGLRVGLAVESRTLFWSTGPLGADRAIIAAAAGRPLAAREREGLRRWLAWLSAANFNQKVFIEPDQEALVQGLLERRLDWIPCNSGNLSRLRDTLGTSLGVSDLPAGPYGPPTPITRLRVLAFGTDSTTRQRRVAEALAVFALNPWIQSTLTTDNEDMLPTNRFVPPSALHTPGLKAMQRSVRQADASDAISRLLPAGDPRDRALSRLVTAVAFGEIPATEASGAVVRALAPHP
ncbi:extracellular solute-binding protein [Cyanobium gracile UHCC 0139]|uniref:Extracellular solute-binding protein n=1 Tax=Cyanobium gracile UHCC 0139 TaxID=3110308 RepID=A0ABU5RXE3_9CYAN|nr:extracellular solute-binding protein [Cyanobium gracile]MEA5392432.1 extracellular solute-binding protein [Cyanobium gracile UHCC 0139]